VRFNEKSNSLKQDPFGVVLKDCISLLDTSVEEMHTHVNAKHPVRIKISYELWWISVDLLIDKIVWCGAPSFGMESMLDLNEFRCNIKWQNCDVQSNVFMHERIFM
jgi:hypothetical protein